MITYCFYKFLLNEDMSTIEFKMFNGAGNDIYPTLSLCFGGTGIFDTAKIKKRLQRKKKPHYREFLLGEKWDEELLNINYEAVTLDARKLIRHISFYSSNATGDVLMYKWPTKSNNSRNKFPFYQSFKSAHEKCYSFDINVNAVPDLKTLNLFLMQVKIQGYDGGVFDGKNGRLWLGIYLTYPNQLIRSFPIVEILNMQERKEKNFVRIMAQGMEIIQRRPNAKQPCKENWTNDDNEIIDQLISKVGCRQQHWSTNLDIPVCKTQDKFVDLRVPRMSTVDASFLKSYVPPCREIQTVISTTEVKNATEAELTKGEAKKPPFTKMHIYFKSMGYKLIRNVRAFNAESLIGNLGGYVGLVLGVAIWQTPDFIRFFVSKFQKQKKIETLA